MTTKTKTMTKTLTTVEVGGIRYANEVRRAKKPPAVLAKPSNKRRGGGYLSERDAAKAWGRSVNAFRVAVRAGRAPAPMGKLGFRAYWYASQFGLGDPPASGNQILTVYEVAGFINRSLRTTQEWVATGKLPPPDGHIAATAFWTLKRIESLKIVPF